MISCKRAAELLSKSMEEQLSLTERATLSVHLFICEFCEQYKKQLETVRSVLRKLPMDQGKQLDEKIKERIRCAVDQEQKKE